MVVLLISSLSLVATLCSIWSTYCPSYLLNVRPISTFVSVCILWCQLAHHFILSFVNFESATTKHKHYKHIHTGAKNRFFQQRLNWTCTLFPAALERNISPKVLRNVLCVSKARKHLCTSNPYVFAYCCVLHSSACDDSTGQLHRWFGAVLSVNRWLTTPLAHTFSLSKH